jgi:hypothetical protein
LRDDLKMNTMVGLRSWRLIAPLLAATIFFHGCTSQSQTSTGSLAGKSYVIEMTNSQIASGFANDLVPPLVSALNTTGLKQKGGTGAGADYAISISHDYDVGKWYGEAGHQTWLHTRTITVGITPADGSPWPQGEHSPAFGVSAVLRTPNVDRVDELECVIRVAVTEAAANYRPTGSLRIDAAQCLRKD